MAGTLHEGVEQIIKLEDRTMEANHRAYREQRRDALRSISTFGQKVVDTVLGSVFRQTKLKVDLNFSNAQDAATQAASSLVVVNDDGIEQVNQLASGTSGLGYLEANAQLRQYLNKRRGTPIPLRELISDLRGILDSHRSYVLDTLQASQQDATRSSMEYLAEPKNSLVVRIKPETFAAIRTSYDLLRNELRYGGIPEARMPTAFDCIEGNNPELCNQFAQLAAYQLAHGRIFSSSSSIYVGVTPAKMNLAMLRTALQKTVLRARDHMRKVHK